MEHRHIPKEENSLHLHSSNSHRPQERRSLAIAMILTGSMMVVEFIGGLIAGSLALISDAGHMLTHFFALGVSYVAMRLANIPGGSKRSYGFYRAEILAALFNGIVMFGITIYIFVEGYKRFINPRPIAELQMLGIAIAGLFVNLVTAFILRGASRKDLNVRSAFFHMLGDTASSIGIVIGAIIIIYFGWLWIDPMLSILIGIVILFWAFDLLRDSINILLESTPKHIKAEDVASSLKNEVEYVKDVHDIHIWEITSQMYAMTAHVVVPDLRISESRSVLNKINECLDGRFSITHANIQFECEDYECREK